MKEKIYFFTPLPPLISGIADYSYELLEKLKDYFDITVVTDCKYTPENIEGVKIIDYTKFKAERNTKIIYNLGNNLQHRYMLPIFEKYPGIIIMHDLNLQGLNFSMIDVYWKKLFFYYRVFVNEGIKSVLDYLKFFYIINNTWCNIFRKYIKKTNEAYFDKNWNGIEYDNKNKIFFRYSKYDSGFKINKKNIRKITMKLLTDHSAKITIKINTKVKKIKIPPTKKYIDLTFNFEKSDKVECNIKVKKPLGIVSKIINRDLRDLGVKISKIKYSDWGNEYEIPLRNCTSLKNNQIYFKELLEKEKIKFIETKVFSDLKNKISFKQNFNKTIIKKAQAIIVHSNFVKCKIKNINRKIPIIKINEGVNINKPKQSKNNLRKKLKLEKYQHIFCSFGLIQKHKQINVALHAFKKFLNHNPDSLYILIGPEDASLDVKKIIEKLELNKNVLLLGHISHKKAMEYIYSSDIAINLRYPSTGATSASLLKILSCGIPCIISDLPENKNFPNNCTIKIKQNKNLEEKILEKYKKLDKTDLAIMGQNAIEYITKNHLWKNIAKKFDTNISNIPNLKYNINIKNNAIGKNIGFIHIARSGGTSTYYYLKNYVLNNYGYKFFNAHDETKNIDWSYKELIKILNKSNNNKFFVHNHKENWNEEIFYKYKNKGFFMFMFIRHPGDRLCSAYFKFKGKNYPYTLDEYIRNALIKGLPDNKHSIIPKYWKKLDYIGIFNNKDLRYFFKRYFNHNYKKMNKSNISNNKGYKYYCKKKLISKETQRIIKNSREYKFYKFIKRKSFRNIQK